MNFSGLDISMIESTNKKLKRVIQKYSFYYISQKSDFKNNIKIVNNIKKSKVSIINYIKNQQDDFKHFIVGFRKSIIIISQLSIQLFQIFFSINPKLILCIFPSAKEIFKQNFNFSYKETDSDELFLTDVRYFNEKMLLNKSTTQSFRRLWPCIKNCISGYLLKEGYLKQNKFRLIHLFKKENEEEEEEEEEQFIGEIDEDDYIELRNVGIGSMFQAQLVYHIELSQLLIIKKPCDCFDKEIPKLMKRLIANHSKLKNPLLPKFYGLTKQKKYIVVEFINGKTLTNIKQFHFTYQEKLTIIFYLISVLGFLNINHCVYRDLKPDNIMVDENKCIVLIDFDRIIFLDDKNKEINCQELSNDFASSFIAPEVNSGNFSYECDVYSFGKMVFYIMNEEEPNDENEKESFNNGQYSPLKKIYLKCTENNPKKRPKFWAILNEFRANYYKEFTFNKLLPVEQNSKYDSDVILLIFEANHNNIEAQYQLGLYYYENDSKRIYDAIHYFTLAANQNDKRAQYRLGLIYGEGKYVKRNIKKSIHYFLLSANQNYAPSQYYLGFIYYENLYIARDINKSIFYFTLSADQNIKEAQYYLGEIYYKGEFTKININKAIKYFTLAADQGNADARYFLGEIYDDGKHVNRDLEKSINYFLLAAEQNGIYKINAIIRLGNIYSSNEYYYDAEKAINYFYIALDHNYYEAYYFLGSIYYEGKCIKRDIDIAIYYFTQIADRNNMIAQYKLGKIYYKGKFIKRDINKAINYLTLSANQNYYKAQNFLGTIYYKGQYIEHDIDKAIYYLTLASNNNDNDNDYNAAYTLGLIYFDGTYVKRDIKRAIHYLTIALKNDEKNAHSLLGIIYLKGIDVDRDINKAIQYLTFASNKNDLIAQFLLGSIYFTGEILSRDLNKAIYYFTLAANQNMKEAQFSLGLIYFLGYNNPPDYKKSIHYFLLAAKQNHDGSQICLGIIFYYGLGIKQDINKSLHYLSLAANQNNPIAYYQLGCMYIENKFIQRNMKKCIHYWQLAANLNIKEANNDLGVLYLKGEYVPVDLKKAEYYFTRSSNQNYPKAQYNLAFLYFKKDNIQDINKGIKYLKLSVSNGCKRAIFPLGYLYFEGKYIKYDLEKAIHYFKEASSFNDNFAKNNLGIIYKNGFDFIPQNISSAIEYFEESISQMKDIVSMYNLAHIYIYSENFEKFIDKSIKLLIESYKKGLGSSKALLCIALIKKYGNNIENLKKGIKSFEEITNNLAKTIFEIIDKEKLLQIVKYESFYQYFLQIDFLYNHQEKIVSFIDFKNKQAQEKFQIGKEITENFYEGFGFDI